MTIVQSFLRILLIVVCITCATAGSGQNQTTASASAQSTETLATLSSEIAASRERVEQLKAAEPDSPVAATVLDLLNQAREQLLLEEKYTSETQEHLKAVREAPAMLARVTDELKQDTAETTTPAIPTTATAEFLAQRVDEKRAELEALESRQAAVSSEQQRRTERLAEIPKELTEVRRQLSAAEFAAGAVPVEEDPAIVNARQLLARASVRAARAHLQSLEHEQERYNARGELLPLAEQLISQRIATKSELITSLTEHLNDLRRQEASASAREIKEAAREVNRSHSLVRTVAAENTSYTEELNLEAIIQEHETLLARLEQVRKEAERTSATFESLKSKFEAVGYSDALGILLRKQRKELPHRRDHREALEKQELLLSEVNLKTLEIQDAVNALGDPAAQAREMIELHASDVSSTESLLMRKEITSLLQARKEYLVKVRERYDDYFRTLIELNAAEEELVRSAAAYADFIDERILWLPSAERVSVESVQLGWQYLYHVFSVNLWKQYGRALVNQARIGTVAVIGGLLLFLLLLFSRQTWKKRLHDILSTASKNRLAAFYPVTRAIFYAALTVVPIPLLLVLVSAPLVDRYDVSIEITSLANGLLRVGIILFVLMLARTIIKRKGLAEVFFVWPESSLVKLRQTFSALLWIFIPSVLIVRASEINGSDASMEAARLVLALALLAVAVLVIRLLRPKNSVLLGTATYKPGSWLYRFRYIMAVGFPALFIILSIACLYGYVYTAIELSQRLNVTFWLGVAVILLNEIIFFWILVKRRRLAIEEARRRREAAKGQSQESEAGTVVEAPAVSAEPAIDIAAISRQAGRLLHVFVLGIFIIGLWVVWADVLPALRYLDTQALWHVPKQVSETTGSDGVTQTITRLVPITLADVLLAAFIGFIAIVAIRNIPGLLDITLFQRFAVQSGERYAFNTLIRYIIILFGLIYIFSTLGLQWSQIQWLAAAVSVGLGFGLQEIFANFVSGLILLFERPVRVGDIVTVGEVTGKVSQIRIRATTIVNWDHKEHIIPNKEFITGQVLNWTLSDKMVRLVINVGVAYGSDYDKAREILLKIARENPHTLDDPAPFAAIDKFSQSSVDFILLAHLPNLDNFGNVKHDTFASIEREFSAAGIEIPYPKMDIRFDRLK